MIFSNVSPDTAATTAYIQSADPTDLATRVNAYFASLAALSGSVRIASISLAGSGDGHSFVCEIVSAPLASISGTGQNPSTATARCFMGGDASSLAAQRSLVATTGLTLGPGLVAGASSGRRFMGMVLTGTIASPGGGSGSAGTSASRLLSSEPQTIAAGATTALAWTGGEITAITTTNNEPVLVTMSINRSNASPPGAGGVYRVRLDLGSVGLSPNDDGDWSSAFAFRQRILIPLAGSHTIGINVTAQTGTESVFQSTLVAEGANVS